jgi:hypothetical protein
VIRMAPPQRGAPPMRIPSTTATAAPKQGAAPAPTTHGAPQVKVNGQSWGPRPAPTGSYGDMPGKAQTRQPDKVDPVANPSQNQKDIVDGHRQRATLAFQGVNYVIQAINNHIQQQRMQERWTKLEPSVRQALAEEPTLGALVRVYYYRRQKVAQEKDSPMEHTNAFADIRIAYGMTREDALTNFEKQAQINAAGAGDVSIDDSMFIPPQLPVDYTKLRTPFQAEGVATFVPGREAFLHLQWAGPNRSFVRRGETKFTAPIKLPEAIRFLYLTPPSEIDYRENKFRFETQEIDWDYQDPGEKAKAGSFGYRFPGVPALDTDSLLADPNMLHAQREKNLRLMKQRAVMVFPLNETTAKMFAAVNSLVDNNGELWNIPSFRKSIRFIHPERLRVLRYFGAE